MNLPSLLNQLIGIGGLVLAGYFFWRQLEEELETEKIFNLTFLIFFWGLVVGRILFVVNHFSVGDNFLLSLILFSRSPGFSLSGSFFTIYLTLVLFEKKNFWIVGDKAGSAFLIVAASQSLGSFIQNKQLLSLVTFILSIIVIGLSFKISKKYRSFSWYQSGKVGFVACFTAIVFFAPFLLLDLFFEKGLYWEKFLEGLIVLGGAVLVYRRSERDFRKDLGRLVPRIRNKQKNG